MSELYQGIIAFSVLAAVVVFIWVMVDLKSVFKEAKQVMETAESTLQTATVELNQNLKTLKKLLEDMNVVTDNVRDVSSSARMIGDNVKKITVDIKDTVEMIRGIPSTASGQMAAIKAGIRTGAMVFFKNLIWGVKPEKEGDIIREGVEKDGTRR